MILTHGLTRISLKVANLDRSVAFYHLIQHALSCRSTRPASSADESRR